MGFRFSALAVLCLAVFACGEPVPSAADTGVSDSGSVDAGDSGTLDSGFIDAGAVFDIPEEDGGTALPDLPTDGGMPPPPPVDAGHVDDDSDAGLPPPEEPIVILPGSPLDMPSDCTPARPSWVGGAIVGSDGRALNVLIGADMKDAVSGDKVDLDGVPCEWPDGGRRGSCCGGYSFCFSPNPSIGAQGSTDAGSSRAWGRCFASNVKSIWFELYPRNEKSKTDKSRYGSAMLHNQAVVSKGITNVLLRLPVTYEAASGNTGTVNGYVTCNGKAIADFPDGGSGITRVRAWSRAGSASCGIKGFSASADRKGKSASLDATYYRVSYLAAGQCNAPSQSYTLFMDAMCGGSKKSLQKTVDVVKGAGLRVDWAF